MPKAKAWMGKKISHVLHCSTNGKIFPIKPLATETQRQKAFILNVFRFIITSMKKKCLQWMEH